jgi:hypothetical protein
MKRNHSLTTALLAAVALASAPAAAQEYVENNFLAVDIDTVAGHTALRTTGGADGDINAGLDNEKILVYGYGNTAETILDVDGQRTALSSLTPESVTNDGATITMTWRAGDVTITREWAITQSSSGNADMVRMATTVQNSGSAGHTVSLFQGIDTMIGANDGAPLFTDSGIIENEVMLEGADVPNTWQAFELDDVANPGLTAMGVLAGGDATKPDRFLLGNWPLGVGFDFDYLGNGSAIADYNDTAVSMWWDGRVLAPGSFLEVVTYYGVGSGTTVAGDLALNVTSPAILTVDAATNTLSPNPFDVNLVVENNHGFTATNVTAQLTLPAGLSLVGGDALAAAGDIPAGGTALLSWQVEATAPAAGTGGTADPADLTEGGAAALALLAFVNDPATDFARLDVDAGVSSTAATNILAHRDGADALPGGGDDDLFDTVAELDAISYVGPATLEDLASYAIANGYATGGGGNAIYTYFVDVTADNDNDVYTASRDVEVPPVDDGVLEGLDVVVHTTDPSDFETIEMIVGVNDSGSGEFVAGLDVTNFDVTEDGVPMNNCTVNLLSESSNSAQADIVFVFDVTGSMDDEIADLKANIIDFADQLETSNVDYSLGLVTFSESVTGVYGMTQDVSEFRTLIQSIFTDSGTTENPLDAVVEAMSMGWRENSDRILILATDETWNVYSHTVEQAMQSAQGNGVRVHAATLPELNPDYDSLVTGTGGAFFDITGTFATVLDDLRDEIINRYQIRCDTPRPVRDNTWRDVNVEVDAGDGRGGEDTGRYFIEGGALRIDPTFSVAEIGSTFTVDVVADSVSDLHNAHIVVDFDPSYLRYEGAVGGELLARPDSSGSVGDPILLEGVAHDPTAGHLVIDVARQSSEGTDGTGVLLTLELTLTSAAPDDADDAETDDLVFGADVYLEDNSLNEIRVTAVSNGDVDSVGMSLLGDFDEDGDIDLVDFNTLVGNWGSTTGTLTGATGGDIGPAVGTAPNLTPSPDGIVNFRDLFVFTRMFNWFRFES